MKTKTIEVVSDGEPEFGDYKAVRRIYGLSRPYLYNLHKEGLIRSVSLRRPGTVQGKRLWVLASIRDFLHQHIEEAQHST
jgi:hypothetical protein